MLIYLRLQCFIVGIIITHVSLMALFLYGATRYAAERNLKSGEQHFADTDQYLMSRSTRKPTKSYVRSGKIEISLRSLIRAFIWRTMGSQETGASSCVKQRLAVWAFAGCTYDFVYFLCSGCLYTVSVWHSKVRKSSNMLCQHKQTV